LVLVVVSADSLFILVAIAYRLHLRDADLPYGMDFSEDSRLVRGGVMPSPKRAAQWKRSQL